MKILYVIDQKPDGYPGGIEYHLLDILGLFIRKNLPVYVLFPEMNCLRLRRYDNYKMDEVAYEGGRLDDHRLRDSLIENVFNAVLDDIDVDIVHFQSIRTLPLSLIEVAKRRGKKVLVTLHEYYFWCVNCIMLAPEFCWFQEDEDKCHECLIRNDYKVHKGFVKERRHYINYLFHVVDRVIVPSSYVKDVLMSLYAGLSYEKCVVIELGVDRELLKEERESGMRRNNCALHLAFLGNFLHYKGNRTFLQLVKHFKNSDTITFSIIGNIFDPSLVPSYKNLNVIGGYTRDNVVKMIHKADPDFILLLSNWPETFSYTLSEAIASGVPVISTDGGALRERVSKESVGFLVPVENPMSRIIEIVEDVKGRPEVVGFLRERVSEARTRLKLIDDMVEEHFEVYDSLT
ncbi:MAG TPA: glycosyltransferase [Thermodesulfovibrionales bacterium]|nr:glycosyltransferase [Thermodesulfovibrionales bacterium]